MEELVETVVSGFANQVHDLVCFGNETSTQYSCFACCLTYCCSVPLYLLRFWESNLNTMDLTDYVEMISKAGDTEAGRKDAFLEHARRMSHLHVLVLTTAYNV